MFNHRDIIEWFKDKRSPEQKAWDNTKSTVGCVICFIMFIAILFLASLGLVEVISWLDI